MPYLNISFWILIGIVIGWFAHSLHLSSMLDKYTTAELANQNYLLTPSTLKNEDDIIIEQQLSKHIIKGNMKAAVDAYSTITKNNPQKKEIIGTHLLDQVERLLGQGKDDYAQNLLTEYIYINAYNPRALFLQAKIYHLNNNQQMALENALQSKIYATTQVRKDAASSLINEIALTYEQQLYNAKKWTQLEQLFALLLEEDPDTDTAQRQYKLGYAQYRQGLLTQATDTLEQIRLDETVGNKANALFDLTTQLLEAEGNIVVVPIEASNAGNWVVNVTINDEAVTLLIDTGASITTLSSEVAESLDWYATKISSSTESNIDDVETIKETTVKTASGISDILILPDNIISVGDITLSNTTLGVMDMPEDDTYDGLLGMDFLSYFEFQIDQTNAVLKLQP